MHIAAQNFVSSQVSSFEWYVFNFFDSVVRWGVPVFVMISGALFLERDFPIRKIFSKNILRLVVSYVIWGAIYAFIDGGGISDIFAKTFRGHYHMWFIPMIIGIYICVPILKKIVESEQIAKYFLTLSFVFVFALPWFMQVAVVFGGSPFTVINNIYKNLYGKMHLELIAGYPAYFILGHMLSKSEFNKKARIFIYVMGIVGAISTMVFCYVSSVKNPTLDEFFYGNLTLNVLAESVAVFVFFKYNSLKSAKIGKIVGKLSTYSFGVYLIHALVIEFLDKQFGLNTLSFNPILAVPCIAVIVCVVAFTASWILNRIPILNKYIV
ncbi:MAG: hypothetical protein E7384_02050 [Ruminococcaceae bacterium]|nr:hypothetical protein [Oscillospiraceae bacterium]